MVNEVVAIRDKIAHEKESNSLHALTRQGPVSRYTLNVCSKKSAVKTIKFWKSTSCHAAKLDKKLK